MNSHAALSTPSTTQRCWSTSCTDARLEITGAITGRAAACSSRWSKASIRRWGSTDRDIASASAQPGRIGSGVRVRASSSAASTDLSRVAPLLPGSSGSPNQPCRSARPARARPSPAVPARPAWWSRSAPAHQAGRRPARRTGRRAGWPASVGCGPTRWYAGPGSAGRTAGRTSPVTASAPPRRRARPQAAAARASRSSPRSGSTARWPPRSPGPAPAAPVDRPCPALDAAAHRASRPAQQGPAPGSAAALRLTVRAPTPRWPRPVSSAALACSRCRRLRVWGSNSGRGRAPNRASGGKPVSTSTTWRSHH